MDKEINLKATIIAGVFVVLVALILGWIATSGLGEKFITRQEQTNEAGDDVESVTISKIIDGDTIELVDKRRVRYIGLSSPKKDQCYAKEAFLKNQELVLNKTVRLEKDASNRNKNGHLLRYVYAEINGEEVFINDFLIRRGFSRVLNTPPDLKFEHQFNQAADDAQFQNRGLWANCY